jgi:predicted DNA-binding transcriptional regulator AlpA
MRIWQIVGDKKREAPVIIPMAAVTIWRLSREGKFPKPYTLSPGVTAWKGEDVQAFIDSRRQS